MRLTECYNMWIWTAVVLMTLVTSSSEFSYGLCKKKLKQRALTAVTQSNNNFAFNIHKELGPGNTIASPLSLLTVLGLAHLAANGSTALQISHALDIKPAFIGIGFRRLRKTLKKYGITNLKIANAVFMQSSFPINEMFSTVSRKVYMAKINNLDFANNSTVAAHVINSWVKRKTRKMIRTIIPTGMLSSDTRLVLVNAVYFKALWKKQFEPIRTNIGTFYISSDRQIDVPMMHNKAYYNHAQLYDMDAEILEMAYKDGNVSMFIILPNAVDGINDLEQQLLTRSLSSIAKKYSVHEVEVTIPKFKLQNSIDFKKILRKLGMKNMFNETTADFSGITGYRENIYVKHILQKGLLEVNEHGTEVGTGTFMLIETTSLRKPATPKFVADHPFFYFIWQKTLNTVLFMGRCTNPK